MEDTTAATLITAGTPTTAAPIMAVIRTVRTAIATLTGTRPTIMARVIRASIRPPITGAAIAVPADQLLRACLHGSPVLDDIAGRSMAVAGIALGSTFWLGGG